MGGIINARKCRNHVLCPRKALAWPGKQTHAGKLLGYLHRLPNGTSATPAQIRDETGLTPGQFKEAMKQKQVRLYFKGYFRVTGSGRNTVYSKIQTPIVPTTDAVFT